MVSLCHGVLLLLLENVHDKMADVKTPYENIRTFDSVRSPCQLQTRKEWSRNSMRCLLSGIFRVWQMNYRCEVARGCTRPTEAMPWVIETEKARHCLHHIQLQELQLESSRRRRILIQQNSRFMTGRQIPWMVFGHLRISDTDGTVLDLSNSGTNHRGVLESLYCRKLDKSSLAV